ncbi:MAG: tail length tape measure protein, partial [Phormidesmis sp. RL_2_1]|nr:tail length tape measure protein [Phormidesmis sp. RL_2_1]
MLKTLKNRWPLVALAGISTLSVGIAVVLLKTTDAFNPNPAVVSPQSADELAPSAVLALASQPPATRSAALSAIAEQERGIEGDRARYLLATDLINQGKGGSALSLLEKLEGQYDSMAPYILLTKAQAQAAAGQAAAALNTWNRLIAEYPGSAAAAEALYQLGAQSIPTDSDATTA